MTIKIAIRELEFIKRGIEYKNDEYRKVYKMENTIYRIRINALEKAIDALEKQTAKKPSFEGDGYDDEGNLVYDTWSCLNCDTSYEIDYDIYDFCPHCGQKIDWNKEENDENNYDR